MIDRSRFAVQRIDTVAILDVNGPLGNLRSPLLEEALLDLQQEGFVNILVDLEHGGYIGSSGIEILVRTARSCSGRGGALSVCGVPDPMQNVFDMLGAHREFSVYRDRTGALLPASDTVRGRLGVRDRRSREDRRLASRPFAGFDRRKNDRRAGARPA